MVHEPHAALSRPSRVRTIIACAILAALVATILMVTQPAAGLSPTATAVGTLIALSLIHI